MDAILQASIEDGYIAIFIARVAEARNLTTDQRSTAVGQGRVWDGGAARQIGLVDQYGGLDDALAWAAAQAELEDGDWHAVFLGAEDRSAYDTLLRQMLLPEDADARPDVAALFARKEEDAVRSLLADADRLMQVKGMQALCLECPGAGPSTPRRSESWLAMLARFFAG